MIFEFQECDTCRARPGSPELCGGCRANRATIAQANEREKNRDAPVPLLLNCPACGERHVDAGPFATKPHHTHACQFCGMTWRPAIAPTVGVQFLPGFKDPTDG